MIFCFLPFLYIEATVKNFDYQNPLMTACLISATFLGTSAAQAIAAEDSIKQQRVAMPQVVFQSDPTTVQQRFKEGASASGGKNPKKLGKRGISESAAEHGKHYCFVSSTIIYMECMEEKIIPFVFHY